MLSNARRLELVIVSATMLVLLIYSKPPRSGNAQVPIQGTETSAEAASVSSEGPSPVAPAGAQMPTEERIETDPLDEMPVGAPPPRPKRIGVVDARNTGNPQYKEIMHGEVSVRWIWNGQKFEPQKVCVVDEGNGVTSVWSFSDHDPNVIITER